MMMRSPSACSLLILAGLPHHLAALLVKGNNRHVILFKDYDRVQGPSFTSMFYNALEETHQETNFRVAFFTLNDASSKPEELAQQREQQLRRRDGLGLKCSETFNLKDLNPLQLEKQLLSFQPSILYVHSTNKNSNAFALRYYMRTSGLDRYVEENCGAAGYQCKLFVGEGVDIATCAGDSMQLARDLQQDPRLAPEPQFRGLGILGTSVLYDGSRDCLSQNTENQLEDVTCLNDDQVFVWVQSQGRARSLIMNTQHSSEGLGSWQEEEPLPPMVEVDLGGRKCIGEPSIDPSRRIQLSEDSEWLGEEGYF